MCGAGRGIEEVGCGGRQEVNRVCKLPHGWELWADPECHEMLVRPLFVKGPRKLTAMEMARQPEAHPVFRELKRLTDAMDRTGYKWDSLDWRAADMARYAIQVALQEQEKWDRSLLENEVGAA